MMTVMDQARLWLTPSRTLAATIHPHEVASIIMKGTVTPTSQPAISTFFRPKRSASPSEEVGEALDDSENSEDGATSENVRLLGTSVKEPLSGALSPFGVVEDLKSFCPHSCPRGGGSLRLAF